MMKNTFLFTRFHNPMKGIYLLLFIATSLITNQIKAQNDLQFYLNAAYRNNPSLQENSNLISISEIDKSLVEAQYSTPQISLTSNYLFAPYFNNNGKLISVTPDPEAVGYDVGITNGGLYAAQLNIEKNIFNGGTIDAHKNQSEVRIKNIRNTSDLLKHTLLRDVTELYLITYQAQQLSILSKNVADTILIPLKITEELVSKGLVKQSSYLLLKIEAENQKIGAEQYLNEFRKNLSELNALCGLNDTSTVNLTAAELSYESTKNESNFYKQFVMDSLLISSQQEIFETKYKPQVNLFFNAGLNAVELEGIQRKFGLSAGINFSLPIYDGDQKSLTQQQTQISLNTVNAFRENQIITVMNKSRSAKIQIEFYERILKRKIISNQINSYEQMLKLSQAELMRGQLSVIEYITLIKNYLELKKNEVTASCNYQLAINQYNYWNW